MFPLLDTAKSCHVIFSETSSIVSAAAVDVYVRYNYAVWRKIIILLNKIDAFVCTLYIKLCVNLIYLLWQT